MIWLALIYCFSQQAIATVGLVITFFVVGRWAAKQPPPTPEQLGRYSVRGDTGMIPPRSRSGRNGSMYSPNDRPGVDYSDFGGGGGD